MNFTAAERKLFAKLGKKGGKRRAEILSREERVSIARKAGLAGGRPRKSPPPPPPVTESVA